MTPEELNSLKHAKKRMNQIKVIQEQGKNKKVKMFVPALVDARLIHRRGDDFGVGVVLRHRVRTRTEGE